MPNKLFLMSNNTTFQFVSFTYCNYFARLLLDPQSFMLRRKKLLVVCEESDVIIF